MYIHGRDKGKNNLFISNAFSVLVHWHVCEQAFIYSKQFTAVVNLL